MNFIPDCLPTLIGSLPLKDHDEAAALILKYTKEIPLWPQLPSYPKERLLTQFSEGLPGIREKDDSVYFDTSSSGFDEEVLEFFEDYLAATEGTMSLEGSRFGFSLETSRGFDCFLKAVAKLETPPLALKGQITGPFTMLTGLKDSDGKMACFNPVLSDAVVKAIALKARYQVEQMKKLCPNVICFLDEPALSGFGSSAMVGITRQDALSFISEPLGEIKAAGAVSGIHVCANTDWSLLLETPLDILSFDAYSYFDKILLFKNRLLDFMKGGGILAWGLIPTLNEKDLERESVDSLFALWKKQSQELGAGNELTRENSLITPSCGTGLLSKELAVKALDLTRGLSDRIRGF